MKVTLKVALVWLALFLVTGTAHSSGPSSQDRNRLLLSDAEIEKIIRHGPWPPQQANDASNRVSGKQLAIEFGEILFFDRRLSINGKISCASCHDPKLGWTDGKPRAHGLEQLDRNSQSLFNTSGNRWFGWDGRNDSLWGHSIGPILDKREMGSSPEHIEAIIAGDPALNRRYKRVFGKAPESRNPLDLVIDIAKAMAAFQETITTGQTPFDRFRDALARKDFSAANEFPDAAQRGAALFVGRGKCNLCHIGARFTNDEFDDVGVPYFIAPGIVDRGRFEGIKILQSSRFNLLGDYNDSPENASGWATDRVAQTHRTFGQFRVPSLRQLTQTAPYMHNGSLGTLEDVVDHYSNIDLNRIHSDAKPILAPLKLSIQERDDLVAFLKSLSTSQTNP